MGTFEIEGRTLRASERPFAHLGPPTLPMVVDATADVCTAPSLAAHVKGSPRAERLLHAHGAILFRGFEVETDASFEEIVTSFLRPNARPMNTYFMSESGREVVPGQRSVLNTSSLYKTGGGFYLGGFHSENFYSTDVPSLQAFWCKEPSRVGGETALVQSANVYDDLSRGLKEKLVEERVLAMALPITEVAARYGVDDEAKVEALCRSAGLEIEDGEVLIFKPPVIRHPHTGRLGLQVNLSGELPGFDAALRRQAAASYRGWRWLLHRALWRSPTFASLLPVLESYPLFLRTIRGWTRGRPPPSAAHHRRGRLMDRLSDDDVEELARAVWRHTSLFTWQRGDVLVCDQLQLLHAGMPGRGGRRELHVMMCAPIRMDRPLRSGLYAPSVEVASESLGEQMARLSVSGQ